MWYDLWYDKSYHKSYHKNPLTERASKSQTPDEDEHTIVLLCGIIFEVWVLLDIDKWLGSFSFTVKLVSKIMRAF